MTKSTHGGSRPNSGAKNRGLTKQAAIKLTPEEFAAFRAIGSRRMRYLIRKEAGLCLHDLQERDDDGILICVNCGCVNPEKFER
jgi:hypothetical protein